MNKKHRTFLSFGLYSLGILSFLLADIYVVASSSKNTVANWAFYKSMMFISASLCILGYDQVLVRTPQLIHGIFKKFIGQSFLIALLISSFLYYFVTGAANNIVWVFANILAFSYLLFFSAAFRAQNQLIKAQFSTNFWKLLLLGCVYFNLFSNVAVWYFVPLFVVLIISFCLFMADKQRVVTKDADELKNARRTGLLFFFHNLTLIVAIYGEQFLINIFNDKEASYYLYSHFVVFTPIALSVNGFLGFYLAPKIRANKNFTVNDYAKLSKKITLFSFAITLISTLIGILMFEVIVKSADKIIDTYIVSALFLLCLIRGIYTSSSVCLGVFASKKVLFITASINWLLLLLYISSITLCLVFYQGKSAAQAIALLSTFHWLLRFMSANYYSKRAFGAIPG